MACGEWVFGFYVTFNIKGYNVLMPVCINGPNNWFCSAAPLGCNAAHYVITRLTCHDAFCLA